MGMRGNASTCQGIGEKEARPAKGSRMVDDLLHVARGHNYHHIPMPCRNVNYPTMAQGPVQDPARRQTGSQNREWLAAPPAAVKLLIVVETVFIWNKGGKIMRERFKKNWTTR